MCTHHGQCCNTIYQNPQSFTISGSLHWSFFWTIFELPFIDPTICTWRSCVIYDELHVHLCHSVFQFNHSLFGCLNNRHRCNFGPVNKPPVVLLEHRTYPSLHPYLLADLKYIRGKHKEFIVCNMAMLYAMPAASSFPKRGGDNSLKRHQGFLETLIPQKRKTHT